MSTDFGALVGAVEKDWPAIAKEAHDAWAAELDALRTAMPGITARLHAQIDSLAGGLITSGEKHLEALRSHFGLPDPATGKPTPAPAAKPLASGGPVPAGMAYTVGDGMPETVVPVGPTSAAGSTTPSATA